MHAKRAKIAKNGDCVPFGIATALPAPHANKGSAFGLDCSLSGQAFAVSAAPYIGLQVVQMRLFAKKD